MVLQVGDRVVVFAAGSPFAYAKKIEPIAVGDKVDVIPLSDGTKLPLPRLELNTDDYVFLIPVWDDNMDIGGGDYSWELLSLGACVFTVTEVTNCTTLKDENREWEPGQLVGCFLMVASGLRKGAAFLIGNNDESSYDLELLSDIVPSYKDWIDEGKTYFAAFESVKQDYISWSYSAATLCAGVSGSTQFDTTLIMGFSAYVKAKMIKNGTQYSGWAAQVQIAIEANVPISVDLPFRYAGEIFGSARLAELGLPYYALVNADYPGYTKLSLTGINPIGLGNFLITTCIASSEGGSVVCDVSPIILETDDCITDGLVAGDKYTIYDPTTKKLVFNDATKTVLSAAYWRAVTAPGEIISIAAVEYIWDGTGHVYLSAGKTTFSTVFYDNEIRVTSTAGTTVKEIAWHSHDTITYGGETVSRELVDITSILRAGKNSVVIEVRDTMGAKVGFPTPVYIKKSTTVISL